MVLSPKELKILDTLQDSPRFLVQKVELNGEFAVLKTAKTKKMITNIQNELLAYSLYEEIISKNPDCPFKIARVLSCGDDWLMLSFLEGRPMIELAERAKATELYDKLAKIMSFCDKKIYVANNGDPVQITTHSLAKTQKIFQEKIDALSLVPKDISIDRALYEIAFDYIRNNLYKLKTCFVNPDLTADHVMIADESLSIFDFENANLLGLRFSDFVNQFTKLWFFVDKEEALKFDENYWRYSLVERDDHIDDLKVLLYARCIGFTWELLTQPCDYHNTAETLNQEFADRIAEVFNYTSSLSPQLS